MSRKILTFFKVIFPCSRSRISERLAEPFLRTIFAAPLGYSEGYFTRFGMGVNRNESLF
jgi:hypothetical protein